MRNVLSRALGAGGGLLVVRAEPAEVAWFNLDAEADRDLRRLWAAPADPPRPARAQPARPPATAPPSAGVAPASARAQPAARSSRA